MPKKIVSLFVIFVFITIALCACQMTAQQNQKDPLLNSQTETTKAPLEEPLDPTPGASNLTDTLDWKTAYLDFIESREHKYGKESEYGFDYRYALVYIDNDDIPELYAMGAYEADGDLICAYRDGRVIEHYLSQNAGGQYVERSGIVINQSGHMGRYYDNVYKLDQNRFSQILNASYTKRYVPLENDEVETVIEYFIDDKAVSRDEYDAAIRNAVDLSQAVEFYDSSVPYDEIKQQIAGVT